VNLIRLDWGAITLLVKVAFVHSIRNLAHGHPPVPVVAYDSLDGGVQRHSLGRQGQWGVLFLAESHTGAPNELLQLPLPSPELGKLGLGIGESGLDRRSILLEYR
jgi:hypothetical protein